MRGRRVRVARRRRWSEADRLRIVAESYQPGVSVSIARLWQVAARVALRDPEPLAAPSDIVDDRRSRGRALRPAE